jgi:hypothetical protein
MSIFIIILIVLAGIFAVMMVLALFIKQVHYVRREIVINAPLQKVFDFLRFLKNQEKFNEWATTDADRKKEFKGTDGTVGFVYSWSGNKKAGQGEKEIMNIIEGKRIDTEIRFVKPMVARASIIMETETISDHQTRVFLTNTGRLNYPLNIMIPLAEKNFARHMDKSLSNLKNILEN